MNELIKELAFKAGFVRSDAGEFSNTIIGTTHADALKNFAELIVKECIVDFYRQYFDDSVDED